MWSVLIKITRADSCCSHQNKTCVSCISRSERIRREDFKTGTFRVIITVTLYPAYEKQIFIIRFQTDRIA